MRVRFNEHAEKERLRKTTWKTKKIKGQFCPEVLRRRVAREVPNYQHLVIAYCPACSLHCNRSKKWERNATNGHSRQGSHNQGAPRHYHI